jgi:hypothetical protein
LQQWLTIIPRPAGSGPRAHPDPAAAAARYPDVPAKVALLLEEIRFFMGDKDIDDADSGLLFQYRHGVLDEQELAVILMRQRRLCELIEDDRFTP